MISVITFLMFVVLLPSGNPASLLAGRLATPAEVHLISVRYGFDKPVYIQYLDTMKNIFTGQAYSYQSGFNVLDEIKAGMGATLSLAIGAGIIWLLTSIVVRDARRDPGRPVHRPRTDGPGDDRRLDAAVLLRRGTDLLRRLQGEHHPAGQLRAVNHRTPSSGSSHMLAPWFTLSVLFIGFYSRVLRSTILDSINEDYVRTARTPRACPSARCCSVTSCATA